LTAILRDAGTGTWRVFENPCEIVEARSVGDVVPTLRSVERACRERALYAAGFISYEAAPGFDAALQTQSLDPADRIPLQWFGLYEKTGSDPMTKIVKGPEPVTDWKPSIDADRFLQAVEQIQELIRAGDTYQVNFTYRLRARLSADPREVFLHLVATAAPPFGAFIETDDFAICSASPELFFHRSGAAIESRPMKGTAPRGLWFEQDIEHGERLRLSEKERSENVMIVDMVRNDLGRVARPGSVRVTNLFDVERYSTVLQLTSTIGAETDASLTDVMTALFPPASITGAPKPRTMEIIAGMEDGPRRIYTGTIGFIEPTGRAQFNVAIRTIVIDRVTGEAEYGVGGGIVADSNPEQELAESRLKSKILERPSQDFDLLETLFWTPGDGYVLLGRHLQRLLQSADYFGFRHDLFDVRRQLELFAEGLEREPHRVRLLMSKRGNAHITATRQNVDEGFPDIVLASAPIDAANPFLYHKTTNRKVYEDVLAARPGFPDVLMFNQRNELTESTIANVVLSLNGALFTPPIACGLLPGTLRAHLLAEGRLRERTLTVEDVRAADGVFLVNSVRGFHPVTLHYSSVLAPTGL
jgi:para-aminobenzoate synthetase/4-amino-4-deoxychorismate lyase